jgi:hypothetical protein
MTEDYQPPNNRPILRVLFWLFPLGLVVIVSAGVRIVTPMLVGYVDNHWVVDRRLTDLAVRGIFVILAIPATIYGSIALRQHLKIWP